MMFRFRDAISFGVVLLLIFGTLFQFKSASWISTGSETIDSLNRSDAKRRVAIRINNDWTTFHLPGNALAVRILSNAIIDKSAGMRDEPTLNDPRSGFRYALEYEFLDDQMNSLDRGVYNFRSNIKEKMKPDSGEIVDPIVVGDLDANVAQTRVMQISLGAKMDAARVVRFRTTELEEGVLEVLTRTVYKTKRKIQNDYGAWDSISSERKKKVAKHSVYEHHLLDHESQMGLLKWEWNRASSVGEPPRRFLYFVGDSDDLDVVDMPFPKGVVVQPGWKVVAAVGDGSATLRVDAMPIDADTPIHGQLHYCFADPNSGLEQFGSVEFAPSKMSDAHSVEIKRVGGMIEVESECAAALRFWCRKPSADDSGQWTEIEMEPKHSPVYIADHRPVGFSVSHVSDQVTPLKVAFRFAEAKMFDAESSESTLTQPRHVHWRFVDDDGQTVDQGVEELNPQVSLHERFWRDRATFAVTDAIKLWFPVPPRVTSVEFWSEDSSVLVNAHTRPDGLAAQTRVPEDYNVVQRLNSPYRNWFTLRPQDHQRYVSENRVLNLGIQKRLPEASEVDRGNLVWNRFLPEGDWLGSRIMVPAIDPLETDESKKPDSVWLWHEMFSGDNVSYNTTERTSHYRDIKIAYASDRPVGPMRIWCNEQLVATKDFATSRGEFNVKLPAVRGSLRIEFNDGVRVFASGMEMDSAVAYYRRTAMRVGNSPTRFEYEKKSEEDELLTLTLYRDASESTRASLKVKIVPHEEELNTHKPRGNWTLRDRSYDLAPLPIARSLLIDRYGNLDSGSRCFIKLGSDMPTGKYTIEVQREDALSGHLLLYQTVPARKTIRRYGVFDNRDLE
jgi:hypothetical protein